MELKGERLLAADRDAAWKALNDIDVLKLCVPGCESITPTGENQYEVAMTAAIGPVKSRFKGKMQLADIKPPSAYTLKFDGSGGAAGFARGEARVELAAVSAQQTKLVYVANAQVGGKLAQVGSRLIDAASGAMADKFFEAFAGQLAARNAPVSATAPPPAAPPQATLGLWALFKAFLKRLFRG
jgi:carbon monoxide dehydrogenase subunit G